MRSASPFHAHAVSHSQWIRNDRRLHEVTLKSLIDLRVREFCWLFPNEGGGETDGSQWPHGGAIAEPLSLRRPSACSLVPETVARLLHFSAGASLITNGHHHLGFAYFYDDDACDLDCVYALEKVKEHYSGLPSIRRRDSQSLRAQSPPRGGDGGMTMNLL